MQRFGVIIINSVNIYTVQTKNVEETMHGASSILCCTHNEVSPTKTKGSNLDFLWKCSKNTPVICESGFTVIREHIY